MHGLWWIRNSMNEFFCFVRLLLLVQRTPDFPQPSTDQLYHQYLRLDISAVISGAHSINHHHGVKHCSSSSSCLLPASSLTIWSVISPHLTPFSNIYCNCSTPLTSQGQSNILLSPEFIKDSKMIKTQFFHLSVLPGQTYTFVTLHLI